MPQAPYEWGSALLGTPDTTCKGAELHILVGIPACGKSTWAAKVEYADIGAYSIFSSDDIREELTGDPRIQNVNDQVFRLFHDRIELHLQGGWPVIADATNLKPSSRKKLMDIADRTQAVGYAHRFFISSNFDECQRRNLGRERVVPEDVMRRFHQNFLDNCGYEQLESEGWIVHNEASGDC